MSRMLCVRCGHLMGALLWMVCWTTGAWALPAFPGAEGFGRNATGGRGGRVLFVTNTNDSGAGSLRDACEQSGPRTVIFRVGGTIMVDTAIRIRNSNITLAGQTAQGEASACA